MIVLGQEDSIPRLGQGTSGVRHFLASLANYHRRQSLCGTDLVIGFGELEASSSLLISLRLYTDDQALQVSGDKFSSITNLSKRGMQKSKDRNLSPLILPIIHQTVRIFFWIYGTTLAGFD
jgi:hypothetical protein